MRRHVSFVPAIVFTLLLALPGLASAQGGQPSIQEIERGLYIQGSVGTAVFLVSPALDGAERPMVGGMAMGVAVGYDVLDVLQIEGFLSGSQVRAPPSYPGLGGPGDPHGDFSTVFGGAKARFAYLSLPDVQGIHRMHLTVHGGAGVLLSRPSTVLAAARPTVLGGAGVHYFTRLRHFTVGAEVDALVGMGTAAVVLHPQVRLSYTF
jgi:hypothetical protein